jgi:hypothetical protein
MKIALKLRTIPALYVDSGTGQICYVESLINHVMITHHDGRSNPSAMRDFHFGDSSRRLMSVLIAGT